MDKSILYRLWRRSVHIEGVIVEEGNVNRSETPFRRLREWNKGERLIAKARSGEPTTAGDPWSSAVSNSVEAYQVHMIPLPNCEQNEIGFHGQFIVGCAPEMHSLSTRGQPYQRRTIGFHYILAVCGLPRCTCAESNDKCWFCRRPQKSQRCRDKWSAATTWVWYRNIKGFKGNISEWLFGALIWATRDENVTAARARQTSIMMWTLDITQMITKHCLTFLRSVGQKNTEKKLS